MSDTKFENDNNDEGDNAVAEALVAYLDGELSAEESRQVEQRLATDAQFRTQLQRLENTWELLDLLPTKKVNDSFTQTTIEIISVAAEDDLHQTQQLQIKSRRRTYLFVAATLVAACFTGFMITTNLNNENDKLVEDYPMLERWEQYEQIDDVTDLELLIAEDLFPTEIEDEP